MATLQREKVDMMRLLILICCTLLATAPGVTAADAHPPIGLVKTAAGDAAVVRDGRRIAAPPGFQLVRGDILSTGATGAMSVILRDDSMLSLGASTETRIEQFAFEPDQQQPGMVVRVSRGIIAYLSGMISKRSPGSVRFETPVATLGVRGTYLAVRIVP
jgi:hypothetical protein